MQNMTLTIVNLTSYPYGQVYFDRNKLGICYSSTIDADAEMMVLEYKEDIYYNIYDDLPEIAIYGRQFECDKKNIEAVNKINPYILIFEQSRALEFMKFQHWILVSNINIHRCDCVEYDSFCELDYNRCKYYPNLHIPNDKIYCSINVDNKIIDVKGKDITKGKLIEYYLWDKNHCNCKITADHNYSKTIRRLVKNTIAKIITRSVNELVKKFN
jgi:hypothetical protein